MNTITIRKLKLNESKLYREIRLKALREYPNFFGSNYQEQANLEKLYFERLIEDDSYNGKMYGAFCNLELIGICGMTFDTNISVNSIELIQMYVSKEHQRKGIATRIINQIISDAKKNDAISSIVIQVNKNNKAAIHVYEKCGFSPIKKDNEDSETISLILNISNK
ncbi:MAG: GNAT family N-acetyltransferase [Pleomorphochaeta sp.]